VSGFPVRLCDAKCLVKWIFDGDPAESAFRAKSPCPVCDVGPAEESWKRATAGADGGETGMRKPLVVVCTAASAVLLAGAIAATTAGADTTPDRVAVLPEVPGVPDLPAFADDPELPDLPAQAIPQQPAQEDPAPQKPAQEPPAQRPAPDDPADEPDIQPDREQPDRSLPDRKPPVRQRPAASANRDVTPGSVSGSLNAPVQRQVLALVNENRRRGGCDGLTLDRRLIVAANRHAADMARRGYFAHRSPNGEGAGDRVEDAGYDWSRYSENIARGQDSPAEVVNGWMNSPGHRENIMDCRLHQMGVGLAFDRENTAYWVQDFATPDR